jgi:CRISPR-associated protein Csm3
MRNRYLFYGEVVTQTALHIGSGRGDLYTDATVVKELRAGFEQPFIPGSSFKGSLRSAVETLVAGLTSIWTCQLTEGQAKCLSVKRDWQEEFREAQEQGASEDDLDKMMFPGGRYPLCHTCLLFGSPFRASKVPSVPI